MENSEIIRLEIVLDSGWDNSWKIAKFILLFGESSRKITYCKVVDRSGKQSGGVSEMGLIREASDIS